MMTSSLSLDNDDFEFVIQDDVRDSDIEDDWFMIDTDDCGDDLTLHEPPDPSKVDINSNFEDDLEMYEVPNLTKLENEDNDGDENNNDGDHHPLDDSPNGESFKKYSVVPVEEPALEDPSWQLVGSSEELLIPQGDLKEEEGDVPSPMLTDSCIFWDNFSQDAADEDELFLKDMQDSDNGDNIMDVYLTGWRKRGRKRDLLGNRLRKKHLTKQHFFFDYPYLKKYFDPY